MVVDFKHGDLVFGKVRGYPPWPARVDETLMPGLKITRSKVPVFFFGTHEIGILAPKDVFLYAKHKKSLGQPQKRTGFNRGLREIEHKPYLTLKSKPKADKEENNVESSDSQTTSDSDSSDDERPPPTKKAKSSDGASKGSENAVNSESKSDLMHTVETPNKAEEPLNSSEMSSSEESSSEDETAAKSDSDKSWKEDQLCDKQKVKRPTFPVQQKKTNYAEKWQLYYERKQDTSSSQAKPIPASKTSNVNPGKEPKNVGVASKHPENSTVQKTTEVQDTEPGSIPLHQMNLKTNATVHMTTKVSHEKKAEVDETSNVTKGKENGSNKNSKSRTTNGTLAGSNQTDVASTDTTELNPHMVPTTNVEQSSAKTTILARKAQRLKQQMEDGEVSADDHMVDKLKNKIAKKEEEKEQKKKEKYERKKREKSQLLRSEVKLRALDLRIKESLNVTKQDIDKCIDAMEKMDAMIVTPLMLKKNPDIVFTLRKCCRYKNSEKVRLKADYIYNKFKSMFLVGQGETFTQVFQNETQALKGIATRLTRDVADMTDEILPAVSERPPVLQATKPENNG